MGRVLATRCGRRVWVRCKRAPSLDYNAGATGLERCEGGMCRIVTHQGRMYRHKLSTKSGRWSWYVLEWA